MAKDMKFFFGVTRDSVEGYQCEVLNMSDDMTVSVIDPKGDVHMLDTKAIQYLIDYGLKQSIRDKANEKDGIAGKIKTQGQRLESLVSGTIGARTSSLMTEAVEMVALRLTTEQGMTKKAAQAKAKALLVDDAFREQTLSFVKAELERRKAQAMAMPDFDIVAALSEQEKA